MEESLEFFGKFGVLLKQLRTDRKLRQLDLATALPVDSTIISKWENGVLYPTLGQLFDLRAKLKLTEQEFERLHYAWRREADSVRQEFLMPSERLDRIVEYLGASITSARVLRKSGAPHVAMALCERDASVALDRIRAVSWSTLHINALTSLSELLVEQCKAGLDFLPRRDVRNGAMESVLNALQHVHQACKGDATQFFADLAREGATYVGGDVDAAFAQSMGLIEGAIPAAWKSEVLRAAAINAGKVGNQSALDLVEQRIEKLLDDIGNKIPAGEQAFLLEGLARGWSQLDPEKGTAVVLSAWDARKTGGDEVGSLLRHVQLVRTEAEIAAIDPAGADKRAMAAKIREAITISEMKGYARYVDQLKELLPKFE